MRALVFSATLLLTAFCVVRATNPLVNAGLTVHEWGTFTSVAGAAGKPVDWNTLGCDSDLPRFVNDHGFRNPKARLRGTVRMETPVLYFYSARELTARVNVAFPQGLITEWYPKADYRVYQNSAAGQQTLLPANLNGFNTYLLNQTGVIEWNAIKVEPGSRSPFPVESAPSRYYAARATDASPVSVDDQHEKFLFYRGVGRIPVPLSALIQPDGRIAVSSTGAAGAPVVMLFENRGGSIGYRNLGGIHSSMTVDRPALGAAPSQFKADLQSALIDQGLYPKEAAAMLDTWQDSWFEEGSRLIYILPQSTVNTMLPLEIEPAPAQTVRVFVGRIELITPETKQAVRQAISKGDEAALALYERFLEPIGNALNQRINYNCR